MAKGHVFCDVQYKSCLSHGRKRGHKNEIGVLQTGSLVIQICKSCRKSGDITRCPGRLLNGIQRVQDDLLDWNKIGSCFLLKQLKHLLLRLIQKLFYGKIVLITAVFYFL